MGNDNDDGDPDDFVDHYYNDIMRGILTVSSSFEMVHQQVVLVCNLVFKSVY